MNKLQLAEQSLVEDKEIPEFKSGDTVNVHYRVREGDKERIQQYKGVVISRRGSGPNQTFICRKISAGNIGVERIFPLYSPFIAKIEVERQGAVRRSKLYYLRELRGKAARIKEKDTRNKQNGGSKNKKAASSKDKASKKETANENKADKKKAKAASEEE